METHSYLSPLPLPNKHCQTYQLSCLNRVDVEVSKRAVWCNDVMPRHATKTQGMVCTFHFHQYRWSLYINTRGLHQHLVYINCWSTSTLGLHQHTWSTSIHLIYINTLGLHQPLVYINCWSTSTLGLHQHTWSTSTHLVYINTLGLHQHLVYINHWSTSTIGLHQYLVYINTWSTSKHLVYINTWST